MKTRAALALSVAGILVTGSAALAVNTQVLGTRPSGTGDANSVLLPHNSSSTAVPTAAASAKATPNVTSVVDGGSTTSTLAKTTGAPELGDGKGGRRAATSPSLTPSPSSEPGDDRDHNKDGTVTDTSDAGPAAPQPGGTFGSLSEGAGTAGDPAVVTGQPGDDKGGLRTLPEPGDDKGGQRKDSGSREDSGGHGSDD
ncbi:hypothetical protein LFT45_16765 [Arthrobacter sp. FW305-BF8]|uniref:hypothetical protein n=1 Tax=Arthrobacter sp. FW305-BF8 TaxID=2879617 RepID=UPI001F2F70B1|nr:hypothetical protein [Arthrobacter sp. FW305-BF8]UKA53360.1 hypothetical protein LFT45_16765 [Arthrobacter sp. FW305-BF8]